MTNQPPYSQPSTLATPAPLGAPDTSRYYGPHVPRPGLDARPPSMWSRVPVLYWVALGVAALGFVVRISAYTISSGSDGYSCSYTDFAGFLTAGALVVLTFGGWATRASAHPARRLPVPLMTALSLLFLALAFVHALRGTGTIMSPCDAHPLP